MRYSENDIVYLKAHWQTDSSYTIAKTLNRAQPSISRKLRQLGLVSQKAQRISESRKLHEWGQQRCLRCRTIYPRDNKHFNRLKTGFQSVCKQCQTTMTTTAYYAAHDSLEHAIKHKLAKAKRYHRARFQEYLSVSDAIGLFHAQHGLCYYSGRPMTYLPHQPTSLSMDRLDPSKSYTKDNVVFCCSQINYMKQDLLPEEFIQLCSCITEYAIRPKEQLPILA